MKPAKASLLRYGFGHTQRRSSVVSQFGQNDSCLAENEFTIVGHRVSIRSRMKAASSMARSHEKSLRHIRLVRVQIDEPPRSKNCCGKQDGELPPLGHFTGLYVALYLASRHDQTICQ